MFHRMKKLIGSTLCLFIVGTAYGVPVLSVTPVDDVVHTIGTGDTSTQQYVYTLTNNTSLTITLNYTGNGLGFQNKTLPTEAVKDSCSGTVPKKVLAP
jgi:hypothetical protein